MKRKTREEKAITLIALIITIVVLLILAVVAINAVTGDGIIQHATNAKTEYEKAQDKEDDMLEYYQGVLQSGEVVPTVEQLQEKYTFSYYSKLSLAITDINNETTENADPNLNAENAVAGIYADSGNNKYVVLMKDTAESTTINVNKSVNINLGGKTLSLTADTAYLNFSPDTVCTIDGRIGGSTIQKNIDNGTEYGIIVANGKGLEIDSGKYFLKGKYSGKIYAIIAYEPNDMFKLNNVSIEIQDSSNKTTWTRAMRLSAKESIINNCSFNVSSTTGDCGGIYTSTGKQQLNQCSVKVSSDNKWAYGIVNFQNTELIIKNTDVFTDASDNNFADGIGSVGIKNQGGTIKSYSSNATGTVSGYEARTGSINCIYGGTLTGMGGAGISTLYGKTYIENTTIKSGEYIGEYNFNNFTNINIKGRAMDIGSTEVGESGNDEMYIDNCTIIGEKEAMKFWYGVNLNISNSTINGKIATSSSSILNLGEGMKKADLEIEGQGIVNETGISYKGMDKTLIQGN